MKKPALGRLSMVSSYVRTLGYANRYTPCLPRPFIPLKGHMAITAQRHELVAIKPRKRFCAIFAVVHLFG